MPHVFPANFPFFEVAAPSRCVLPDFSDVGLMVGGTPPLNPVQIAGLHNSVANFPGLNDIKLLCGAVLAPWTPPPGPPPFIQKPRKEHWDVFLHLRNDLGKAQIPLSFCNTNQAGATEERRAWVAATKLFNANPTPPWTIPAGNVQLQSPLRLDAIFSSVWVDRQVPFIPYILDQLWVMSWAHAPERRILVGVEIDGSGKWDVQNNGDAIDGKDQNVFRSNFILSQNIALFRIGSATCNTQSSADQEVVNLWSRLSTAAFLRRMNIVSFLPQDANDVVGMFQLAFTKFQAGGYVW